MIALSRISHDSSEPTQLEADGFAEYVGKGKLKDKNVLITEGD
jgi:hypothetical protein